ncbi:MAG TPA: hypothetical protein VJW77_14265 [Terriglobia bacterium]|nr:hypothetical protein [Terriglobia bacterium]
MSIVRQWGLAFLAVMVCGVGMSFAQIVTVNAHVVIRDQKQSSQFLSRESHTVLWLTPSKGWTGSLPRPQTLGSRPQLVQKNKQFVPQMLAVEVGSVVDFPNHDPFFHNVFSLFNGKRFDLGLYEAGSTRSVHFDRPGICYIFCNIHPQMSAIVVVVNTPYFAISNKAGDVQIPDVPVGQYKLNVWEEHCSTRNLQEAAREVTIGPDVSSLGTIRLEQSQKLVLVHPNKYGRNYDPEVFSSPIYSQP